MADEGMYGDATPLVETNDVASALDAGRKLVTPREVNPEKIYTVVHDDSVVALDLERFMSAPRRKRGVYKPATADSFIDYVERHHGDDTTVWVHPSSGRIVAVIDDAGLGAPAWREHTVATQLAHTPEWNHWTQNDGKMVGQVDFAEHIEDGLNEIVSPDAATMLEIAQTFHAHTTAQFRSSNRLTSGEQQLQYDESVTASAGTKGELNVPTELELGVAPFVGGEAYRLTARLRFRVTSGKLTLGYRLDRPDRVIRDALENVVKALTEKFPNVYLGDPPVNV